MEIVKEVVHMLVTAIVRLCKTGDNGMQITEIPPNPMPTKFVVCVVTRKWKTTFIFECNYDLLCFSMTENQNVRKLSVEASHVVFLQNTSKPVRCTCKVYLN